MINRLKTKKFIYQQDDNLLIVTCIKTGEVYTYEMQGKYSQPLLDNVINRLRIASREIYIMTVSRRFFMQFMSKPEIRKELTFIRKKGELLLSEENSPAKPLTSTQSSDTLQRSLFDFYQEPADHASSHGCRSG